MGSQSSFCAKHSDAVTQQTKKMQYRTLRIRITPLKIMRPRHGWGNILGYIHQNSRFGQNCSFTSFTLVSGLAFAAIRQMQNCLLLVAGVHLAEEVSQFGILGDGKENSIEKQGPLRQ